MKCNAEIPGVFWLWAGRPSSSPYFIEICFCFIMRSLTRSTNREILGSVFTSVKHCLAGAFHAAPPLNFLAIHRVFPAYEYSFVLPIPTIVDRYGFCKHFKFSMSNILAVQRKCKYFDRQSQKFISGRMFPSSTDVPVSLCLSLIGIVLAHPYNCATGVVSGPYVH